MNRSRKNTTQSSAARQTKDSATPRFRRRIRVPGVCLEVSKWGKPFGVVHYPDRYHKAPGDDWQPARDKRNGWDLVIADIFRIVFSGRTPHQATARMNQSDVPMCLKDEVGKLRYHEWTHQRVVALLTNDVYVKVGIVSQSVFDSVQDMLPRGGRYSFQPPGTWLLTGKLRCWSCRGPMAGEFSKGRKPEHRYACNATKPGKSHVGVKAYISRDRLEAVVLKVIAKKKHWSKSKSTPQTFAERQALQLLLSKAIKRIFVMPRQEGGWIIFDDGSKAVFDQLDIAPERLFVRIVKALREAKVPISPADLKRALKLDRTTDIRFGIRRGMKRRLIKEPTPGLYAATPPARFTSIDVNVNRSGGPRPASQPEMTAAQATVKTPAEGVSDSEQSCEPGFGRGGSAPAGLRAAGSGRSEDKFSAASGPWDQPPKSTVRRRPRRTKATRGIVAKTAAREVPERRPPTASVGKRRPHDLFDLSKADREARMSCRDLADKFGVSYVALKPRLKRWRKKHDVGFEETPAGQCQNRNEPRIMYTIGAVLDVIKEMRCRDD